MNTYQNLPDPFPSARDWADKQFALTEAQTQANKAFYRWEVKNNEQNLSDRDRMLWTAGWRQAIFEGASDD